MSSSAYSTPPPNRRPPLRHNSSTVSAPPYNSPVRSFSMPTTTTTTSSPGSSRSSPTTSRRGSWDCEKMSMSNGDYEYNEKERDQEIYMGALVSPGSGDWEKSIEVPCIILTEPDHHHRAPTPLRPKQILLLPPTSLPLPLHSTSNQSMSTQKHGWALLCRAALVVCVVGLGGWHLWGVLGGGEREGL